MPEEDPEYGLDCINCYPAGKTPKYLWACFTGIVPGAAWRPTDPNAPNGNFKLTQSDTVPCFWTHRGTVWDIDFVAANHPNPDFEGVLILKVEGPGLPFVFIHWAADECMTDFDNQIVEPPEQVFIGGNATIVKTV